MKFFAGLVNRERDYPHEATLTRGPAKGDRSEDRADLDRITSERRKHGLIGRIRHGRRYPTGR